MPLKIQSLSGLTDEVCRVLSHLGVDSDEIVEKMHAAPLGDPIALKIGEQIFSLRSEVCKKIEVEKV